MLRYRVWDKLSIFKVRDISIQRVRDNKIMAKFIFNLKLCLNLKNYFYLNLITFLSMLRICVEYLFSSLFFIYLTKTSTKWIESMKIIFTIYIVGVCMARWIHDDINFISIFQQNSLNKGIHQIDQILIILISTGTFTAAFTHHLCKTIKWLI